MCKSHIWKARPCLWSRICQLQALPVPNRGCRARKQIHLCFLMQLNPKLSMEAGKTLSTIGCKAMPGSAMLLGAVKCHLLLGMQGTAPGSHQLLPDCFKELEASPGAPAFLPLGLGLSYLSKHDISQPTSSLSLCFPPGAKGQCWNKGVPPGSQGISGIPGGLLLTGLLGAVLC